jgi:hypothetical protein
LKRKPNILPGQNVQKHVLDLLPFLQLEFIDHTDNGPIHDLKNLNQAKVYYLKIYLKEIFTHSFPFSRNLIRHS